MESIERFTYSYMYVDPVTALLFIIALLAAVISYVVCYIRRSDMKIWLLGTLTVSTIIMFMITVVGIMNASEAMSYYYDNVIALSVRE